MIFTEKKKIIRVMLTTFRDGLQSSFGGKVRLADFLPAIEVAAKEVGARHLEFGGGGPLSGPTILLERKSIWYDEYYTANSGGRCWSTDFNPLRFGSYLDDSEYQLLATTGKVDGQIWYYLGS